MASLGNFTGFNAEDTCTIAPSDTVNFKDDATNNPRQYPYFWFYTLTTGNIDFIDLSGNLRTLTGIAANVVVQIPMRRANQTNTTATGLALIPKSN